MSGAVLSVSEINDSIEIVNEKRRELIKQAAAYSGAADEELMARRIADQEEKLESLKAQRDQIAESMRNPAAERLEIIWLSRSSICRRGARWRRSAFPHLRMHLTQKAEEAPSGRAAEIQK